jgi:hypothetical protein
MPQFNDFRCQACNLYFSTDLDESEVLLCRFCGHQRPEPVKIVACKSLCAECAGRKRDESGDDLETALDEAMREVGL